ncbi:DMT family transporter [Bacteroides sp. GD17]|jgi:drug/metabolite transporter (DMT)-like permease|uniref:DMT family transporter n=1 Tax=Bacteroides sp. GD17 TaxID=3139826 RepID=UPI0025DCEBFD|nr:DMT family transporter [uncultured Bacteroides sp.]
MNKINGFLYGLLSSASFGLIPLFTIPAMHQGMDFWSILLYRFLFAMLALAGILLLDKQSFRIRRKEILPLLLLASLYDTSAVFLFWGYKFMASGVATTIHFMYPVLTTLIMMIFFREKKSFWRMGAIVLAVSGVFFLSQGDTTGTITWFGIFIVLLSALGYALYLVTVSQLKKLEMKGLKMTFYVFLFGGMLLFIGIQASGIGLQAIPDRVTLGNLVMLALVPTVISNLALVRAIKNIGSTLTSVLGAMEPVTAVGVGILVFGEPFTNSIAIGILLIISAVTVIILKR